MIKSPGAPPADLTLHDYVNSIHCATIAKNISPDSVRSGKTCPANLGVLVLSGQKTHKPSPVEPYSCVKKSYRISSYCFNGKYSFFNLEIQRSQYINVWKLFKGGNMVCQICLVTWHYQFVLASLSEAHCGLMPHQLKKEIAVSLKDLLTEMLIDTKTPIGFSLTDGA